MKQNNIVYAHNIREASAIAESLIAAGITEYHARYLPDSHVYEIRYPKTEKEETTMPDLINELESLRTRVHNLNLYLRTVQGLVPESTWETLLRIHSGLPGYSAQEAGAVKGEYLAHVTDDEELDRLAAELRDRGIASYQITRWEGVPGGYIEWKEIPTNAR